MFPKQANSTRNSCNDSSLSEVMPSFCLEEVFRLTAIFFLTGNLRCYELFTLYLSALSVEAVAHHDRDLIAVLLNRAVK